MTCGRAGRPCRTGNSFLRLARDPLTLSLLHGQRDELGAKYHLVKKAEDAREGWEAVYESSLDACMHGANCMQGRDCQVGPSGFGHRYWTPFHLNGGRMAVDITPLTSVPGNMQNKQTTIISH